MKNLLMLMIVVILTTSCTVYIPHETEYVAPDSYRLDIILNIYPEDAKVIVDGRFVGEAYEFSTERTSLRVEKRSTSIIIKKQGFMEESIDLKKYGNGVAKISIDLRRDRGTAPSDAPKVSPLKPEAKTASAIPTEKEKEIAKREAIIEKSGKTPEVFIYKLKIKPSASAIYIDGKFWGTSPADGMVINNMRLTKGEHKIDIFKPGYKKYSKKIVASEKSVKEITITLVKPE